MATTITGTTATETFGTTSTVTGTPPTISATDGLALADLTAVACAIACPSGGTFSSGTMQCYIYDPVIANWARAADFDLTVPSGSRFVQFQAYRVLAPRNARIKWNPSTVAFSSGSTGVVMTIQGYAEGFRGKYA